MSSLSYVKLAVGGHHLMRAPDFNIGTPDFRIL